MKQNINKPISQFNDLIILILYVICLINIQGKIHISVFLLTIAVSLIFGIKYLFLKNKIRLSGSVLKQYLINQRDSFLNSLSHDLRIPIIAQLRILELMNRNLKKDLNENQIDMLFQAEVSCRNILNLISLLINTYSTENNTRKLIYKNFNLKDTIFSCIKELQNDAHEKNISFEYESNCDNLSLYADKEDIRNVVLNILLSSIINSVSNCKIKIKAERISKKIRLSVTWKNENYNCNSNTNFAAIGQSTRLYFCKKIIEIHKGHFVINHNIPNTFVFELPQKAFT